MPSDPLSKAREELVSRLSVTDQWLSDGAASKKEYEEKLSSAGFSGKMLEEETKKLRSIQSDRAEKEESQRNVWTILGPTCSLLKLEIPLRVQYVSMAVVVYRRRCVLIVSSSTMARNTPRSRRLREDEMVSKTNDGQQQGRLQSITIS